MCFLSHTFLVSDETKARYRAAGIDLPDYAAYKDRCPNCERATCHDSIWMEHRLLLGTRQDMDDIAGAFTKVVEDFAG